MEWQWLHYFSDSRIQFYIYKLNKGDSINHVLNNIQHKYLLVLYGSLYTIKIFNNKTTIAINILDKGDIIQAKKPTKYYHHALIAITTTFLLSFILEDTTKEKYINLLLFNKIIQSYNKTLSKYEIMNSILVHKSTRNRIIQLILTLSKQFAVINNKQITIPFYISQATISNIIGSNRNTVNHIINNLRRVQIIAYSNKKYICIVDPFILSFFYKYK